MQTGGRIYGSGSKGSVIDIFKNIANETEIINKDYFANKDDELSLLYFNQSNTEIETLIIDKNILNNFLIKKFLNKDSLLREIHMSNK
jgi:hypothetical protein